MPPPLYALWPHALLGAHVLCGGVTVGQVSDAQSLSVVVCVPQTFFFFDYMQCDGQSDVGSVGWGPSASCPWGFVNGVSWLW